MLTRQEARCPVNLSHSNDSPAVRRARRTLDFERKLQSLNRNPWVQFLIFLLGFACPLLWVFLAIQMHHDRQRRLELLEEEERERRWEAREAAIWREAAYKHR